jgi:response regulator of citrate/malate metabolism
MPKYYEQEEIDSIFKQYEEAYEQNDQVDDGIAKDVIKRAKRFLLKNPDL